RNPGSNQASLAIPVEPVPVRKRRRLPRWRGDVFVLEAEQRLFIGQLLAHPERIVEVRVSVEHFDGACRGAFKALAALHAEGRSPFAPGARLEAELAAVGVPLTFLIDCALEWGLDHPMRLSDVERALEAVYVRRRLFTAAEALAQVAQDVEAHPCVTHLVAK